MNEFPWYKMFPKDWLTSETIVALSLEELGMFVTLLNNAWINNGLSPDEKVLMKLCHCDEHVFEQCWISVQKLFVNDGERLRNNKQEILRKELKNIKKAKSKAGKASGIVRRKGVKKEVNTCSTSVEHNSNKEDIESESDTDKELILSNDIIIVPAKPKFTNEQIDKIYNAYPRKIAPAKAKPAIKKALQNIKQDNPVEWLLNKTIKYAKARSGKDNQFTPHPATWYNGERYNDDMSEWGGKQTTIRKEEFAICVNCKDFEYKCECGNKQLFKAVIPISIPDNLKIDVLMDKYNKIRDI